MADDVPRHHNGHAEVETAISELDKILQPPSPSLKRARSSSRKSTSVSTPALMSVLPPSRKRQRLSWLAEEQLKKVRSPAQVYRPSSREDLVERIATFTLTLWNDRKPEGCSAVEFARHGWKCTGKKREEVSCDVCKANWQVAAAAGLSNVGDALQRDIRDKHAKSCPWRHKACSSDLYRLHVSAPPSQLLRELLERASSFPFGIRFSIKHPLSTEQETQLDATVSSSRGKTIWQSLGGEEASSTLAGHASLVAALFGWAVPSSSSSPGSSSPSTSTSTSTSTPASVIVQCKLCARRLAVKGTKQAPTSQSDSTTTETAQSSSVSPDKLSQVDVASSHRRFCPYISPVADAAPRLLGYEALLERISHVEHHPEQPPVVFEPTSADRSKSNVIHTREALRYVKSLLEGAHTSKRKYAIS